MGNKYNRKHGMYQSYVYSSWKNMKHRCYYIYHNSYDGYGGRGITVCERWHNFINFYADMGDPPTQQHSIDRIDNNGNYEPGNCRWATKKEQVNNTQQNRFIEYQGKRLTIAQWAEKTGIPRGRLYWRINNQWSVEEIFDHRKWRGNRYGYREIM